MISVDGGLDGWWHLDFDVNADNTYFNWTFNNCGLKDLSLTAAADYTAKLVAEKFDNLHLLMSGGLDSEFVADILHRNNVPFTPVIGFIPDSHNQDYFYAMHWCSQRGIKPLEVEFKINDFRLQKDHAWLCQHYGMTNEIFFVKALTDIVLDRNGHVLVGETTMSAETIDSKWEEPIGETFDITLHALFGSIYTQGTHPAEFFSYTPELFLSLITEIDTTLNNAVAKSRLYNVPFRPKTWPFVSLRDDVKSKIQKACKVEGFPNHVGQSWTREELVGLLTKHK